MEQPPKTHMIKKLIYRLLERRHFWRHADFGEIAELYASRTLRVMAISMVSTFVAVYLYQNGYHLSFIMMYFAFYFGLRAGLTFPAAFVIARIGPKHATLISNLIYVPTLIVFSQLGTYGIPVLIIAGLLQAMSVSLYDLSHLVNFSKVKHVDHVGKELSFMYMLERIGASISPVIGGVIAFWFGIQITMLVAACVFALAALPLFFTGEPVRTHQQITFRQFNWKDTWRGLLANVGVGADFITSGSVWALYVAIAIFGATTNAVYAQLGALVSVTVLAALVFSRLYGLIIDRRRGGTLLKAGVIGDSLVHLARPFVNTPIGAVFINVFNESATTAYSMPFAKGAFEQADNLPGYRIVYMTMIGVSAPIGAMLMALIIAGISLFFDEVRSMQIAFLLTAVAVLLIRMQRFPALRRYSPL
jgi:MFS family permease